MIKTIIWSVMMVIVFSVVFLIQCASASSVSVDPPTVGGIQATEYRVYVSSRTANQYPVPPWSVPIELTGPLTVDSTVEYRIIIKITDTPPTTGSDIDHPVQRAIFELQRAAGLRGGLSN